MFHFISMIQIRIFYTTLCSSQYLYDWYSFILQFYVMHAPILFSGEDPRIKFDANKAILELASISRFTSISCGWVRKKDCSQHKKLYIAVFNQGKYYFL